MGAMSKLDNLELADGFETARLIVRRALADDAQEFNQATVETFDQLQRWFPWAKQRPSIADTQQYLQQAGRDYVERTAFHFMWLLKEGGTLVGRCGLHQVDWEKRSCALGYWTRQNYQKQGFAAEAIHGVTAFAFEALRFNQVNVLVRIDNAPSRRLAEMVGYQLHETRVNGEQDADGQWHDQWVFTMSKQNFQDAKATNPDRFSFKPYYLR
jgi:RimJ/RimL family protein N-acetyltransferase